jgi:hypothetical protein
MRSPLFCVLILAMTVGSAACNRDSSDRARDAAAVDAGGDGPEITVTGCLTGAPDRSAFVVTASRDALASGALHSGLGEVPTYTYELVGGSDLQAHVGRTVQVTGRVDEDRKGDIDVDTKSKVELPQTRVGDKDVTPAIETREEVEVEVRRLHVSSLTPMGQPCQRAQ